MIETFFSGKSLEIISNWHAAYQSFVGANIVFFSVFSYTKNENWGSDVAHTSIFEWCYEYLMETRAHSIDIIPMNLGRIFLAIWAAQHIECDKNVILSGQKKMDINCRWIIYRYFLPPRMRKSLLRRMAIILEFDIKFPPFFHSLQKLSKNEFRIWLYAVFSLFDG